MDSSDGGDQEVMNFDNDSDNEPQQQNMGQDEQELGETEKVENQPFDEAVEVNDSGEELDSEESDDVNQPRQAAVGDDEPAPASDN